MPPVVGLVLLASGALVGALPLASPPPSPPSPAAPRPHPRLFFEGDAPPPFPWPDRVDQLRATPQGKALHWHYTGDEASARACRDVLLAAEVDDGYGLAATGPVLFLPLAYDWLAPWDGLADADRRAIEEKILATGRLCRDFLDGDGDHVFHTSAPRALMGAGLAGLVLEGHHPEGAELVRFARRYLRDVYAPAMEHLDGAAVAGMSYGVAEGFAPLLWLLRGLETARGEALWDRFPWLERRLAYLIDATLPDQTFVRWGDIVGGGRASTRDEVRPVVDALARAYASEPGWALSDAIAARWSGRRGYHPAVLWAAPFHRPPADRKPPAEPPALPLAALYGRESVGQAFFRSSRGPDATVAFWKCGDYYDDHGHFDQGSFTIYRRGHLALDAFAYGGFREPHRVDWGRHTIAHNVLLFGDEDIAGGQRVASGQTSQDLADHLRKKARKGFEAGEIVAWRIEDDFVHAAGELGPAYDGEIVDRFRRELVWLDGRHLIVLDRVRARRRARFLLHASVAPEIEGDRATITTDASVLHVRSVLPERPTLTPVRGWRADGKDHPPGKLAEFHVPGGHRLEVAATGPAPDGKVRDEVFLHVLTAADPGEAAPEVRGVSGAAPAVVVDGWRVTFGRSPTSEPRVRVEREEAGGR